MDRLEARGAQPPELNQNWTWMNQPKWKMQDRTDWPITRVRTFILLRNLGSSRLLRRSWMVQNRIQILRESDKPNNVSKTGDTLQFLRKIWKLSPDLIKLTMVKAHIMQELL